MSNKTKLNFKHESLMMFYETYQEIKISTLPTKKNLFDFLSFMKDYTDTIYKILHNDYESKHLQNADIEKEIRKICNFVIDDLYPYYNEQIFKKFFKDKNSIKEENKEELLLNDVMEQIEDKMFSIMAYRSVKYFAYYIEREKVPSDRIWGKTMHLFEPFFYYSTKMVLTGEMELIRASYFPGAGKTYAGNLLCAYWFGYNPNMSFLRITYSDDLAKSFTNQIKNIIKTKQFKNVFPQFDMPENQLFEVNQSKTFKFSFSKFYNFYADTTSGKPTGKRAKCLMIDDVSKGVEEANNPDKHKEIVNKYDYNWTSRTDNEKMFKILLGTMWNPNDLLNVVMRCLQLDWKLMLLRWD